MIVNLDLPKDLEMLEKLYKAFFSVQTTEVKQVENETKETKTVEKVVEKKATEKKQETVKVENQESEKPEDTKKQEVKETDEPSITLEQLREGFKNLVRQKKQKKCKAILESVGVVQVSDIPLDKYQFVYDEILKEAA